MIPSTTRAPRAYSNDGCTVTARARLTPQSFPTNKTLNTGPLPLSSALNTAMSCTRARVRVRGGEESALPVHICFPLTLSLPVHGSGMRQHAWRMMSSDFKGREREIVSRWEFAVGTGTYTQKQLTQLTRRTCGGGLLLEITPAVLGQRRGITPRIRPCGSFFWVPGSWCGSLT